MEFSEAENKKLIEALKQRDRVVRAISEDGHFRITCIKNTNSAKEAQRRHNLPYPAAFLLARALAGASMMASFLKGQERISLEFQGNGLIEKVFAEALQVGEQRGFVEFSEELFATELKSISELLRNGILKVVRILYNRNEPITSVIKLYNGDIASDLAYYYLKSEQIPTAVILDVNFDDNGIIKQSGGLMVQAMPGTKKKDIENVYEHLKNIEPFVGYLEDGLRPDEIIKQVIPFTIKVVSSTQVDFFCRCSKETFIEKLLTLNINDIKEMQSEGQNELVCRYCNEKYYLDEKDYEYIINTINTKMN